MAVSDDDRLMMRLTGLSYRGFWRTGWGDAHVRAIRSGIDKGLKDRDLGLTAWQIVWGPACFRPPLGWFDDQVTCVMHDPTVKPMRFVIVIRGTNPISLSDWIFGDLLVHPPFAWPFNPAAHLTPSTAIGLSILLSLGAEPSVALARIQGLVDTAGLEKAAAATIRFCAESRPLPLHRASSGWVSRAISALSHRGRAIDWVSAALRNQTLTQAMAGARKDLMAFLRDTVASSANDIEVVVTGHSKGGALAAAFTAWLAETRCDNPFEKKWDPQGKVRLRCFTFAAPTPGDLTFANILLQRLKSPADFRRTWNRVDVVPHAFSLRDLDEIPNIYEAELILPLLEKLRKRVQDDNYSQIGDGLPFPPDPNRAAKLPLLNAVDNHMEQYLHYLGIRHSTPWFFLGTEPGFFVRQILGLAGHREKPRA